MTTEEQQNAAIVRRTLDTYGAVPLDRWLADYAIDLIYEEPGFSGQVLDRSALGAALARQFAAHPGIGFLTHDIIAAGNRVIAEGEVRWQEPGRTRIVHQALFYTLSVKLIRSLRVYAQPRS
jgi:hypothetical protein